MIHEYERIVNGERPSDAAENYGAAMIDIVNAHLTEASRALDALISNDRALSAIETAALGLNTCFANRGTAFRVAMADPCAMRCILPRS